MFKKLLFLLIPITFLFSENDWSLDFPGEAFIDMSPFSLDNTIESFSISFWFNSDSINDVQYMLSQEDYNFFFSIHLRETGEIWAGYSSTYSGLTNDWIKTGDFIEGEHHYDDSLPHHVVLVIKNNTSTKLYIDGDYIGASDNHAAFPDNQMIDFVIAKREYQEPRNFFNGNLDDVQMWYRDLSELEVEQLYDGDLQESDHHWSFDEGLGNVVYDNYSGYYGLIEGSPSDYEWVCNDGFDECGECGGDGPPDGFCDCDGNVEDCNGDCGGDAVVDECGVCNGDNYCIGCTDETACNYSDVADEDDGSCEYITCYNTGGYVAYNSSQNFAKGPMLNCEYDVSATTYGNISGPRAACYFAFSNPESEFYIEGTSIDDWLAYDCGEIGQWSLYECQVKDFEILGCMDENACNYNPYATEDNNSCDYDCEEPEPEVYGCTYEDAINYDENATVDDGSCEFEDPMVGDLNGDGIINILDAVQLIQIILDFFIDDSDIENK